MKKLFIIITILFGLQISAQTIFSPHNNLTLKFELNSIGEPIYSLLLGHDEVIKTSKLGIELKNQDSFLDGFVIEKNRYFNNK